MIEDADDRLNDDSQDDDELEEVSKQLAAKKGSASKESEPAKTETPARAQAGEAGTRTCPDDSTWQGGSRELRTTPSRRSSRWRWVPDTLMPDLPTRPIT